jgi:hypothetical protein
VADRVPADIRRSGHDSIETPRHSWTKILKERLKKSRPTSETRTSIKNEGLYVDYDANLHSFVEPEEPSRSTGRAL